MKVGLKCTLGIAIILIGLKAVDLCLDQFNHAWFPGGDILSLLGVFASIFLTVILLFEVFIADKKIAAEKTEKKDV